MENKKYHPEDYWSDVARKIGKREDGTLLAGDNEPYYDYKRKRFLEMLSTIDFRNKKVMELGSGPGGNVMEVLKSNPTSVTGADISSDMVALARKNVTDIKAHFEKIDGTTLPFQDQTFDVAFTATVLQHNSDDEMMKKILREVCRVTKEQVVLFEKVDTTVNGDDLCMARPVPYFAEICKGCGFELVEHDYINIRPSYFVSGAIRKLFNAKGYKEGDVPSNSVVFLQKATLPITKILDPIFTSKKDLARMVFKRK